MIVHGDTSAAVHFLDLLCDVLGPLAPRMGLALEAHGDPGLGFRLAVGAGFEVVDSGLNAVILRVDGEVLWNVKGVALSVTEVVDHRSLASVFGADRLTHRLRFAPVTLQQSALGDELCSGDRLQHVLALC